MTLPSTLLIAVEDVKLSLGPVLLGSTFGALLSGIVCMQTFLYYKLYPEDPLRFRVLVGIVWLMDLLHAVMACASSWGYLISHFGNAQIRDWIAWQVTVTIMLTAFIIFFVQSFFAYRIFTLSSRNIYVMLPIAILAILRLATALVSASKMIELQYYSRFVEEIRWVFTLVLSLGTAVDILIALALCWYLNKNRTGFASMEAVIDSIILYTIETGVLTSTTTVVSLVCWLTMPHNLVFLGLHFAISKLYANMLLASLNARKVLRGRTIPVRNFSDLSLSFIMSQDETSKRVSSHRDRLQADSLKTLAKSTLKEDEIIEECLERLEDKKSNSIKDVYPLA